VTWPETKPLIVRALEQITRTSGEVGRTSCELATEGSPEIYRRELRADLI
jgi:hypothetical protein